MLECRNVTKTYVRKTAVDGVSFQIEPGRVYAMLGPNGSGKTTLMKMAVGLVKPTSGGFFYKGRPVGQESRREIAYMSTEPYFYNWMTIRDVEKYYADFFEDFSSERFQNMMADARYEDEGALVRYDGKAENRSDNGKRREDLSAR